MLILFKYNRALQDKFATHRAAHLPSSGIYVQPSDDMIATWKRKEQDHHGVYCEQMDLAWRQSNSQFTTRQPTLKLDKDFKDLDEEVAEDPRQADRLEQSMDNLKGGLLSILQM